MPAQDAEGNSGRKERWWFARRTGTGQMSSPHAAVSPRAEQERLTHALRAGRPVLMFFYSSHCPLCRTLYAPVRQLTQTQWLHVAWADTDAPEVWLPEVCLGPPSVAASAAAFWKTRTLITAPLAPCTDGSPPRAGDLRAELRGVAAPTRRRARAGASPRFLSVCPTGLSSITCAQV